MDLARDRLLDAVVARIDRSEVHVTGTEANRLGSQEELVLAALERRDWLWMHWRAEPTDARAAAAAAALLRSRAG